MCDLGSVNRTLFYTKTGRTHVVKASEGGQENEHGERDDSVPLRGGEARAAAEPACWSASSYSLKLCVALGVQLGQVGLARRPKQPR
jgi:hypothetical protein